MSLEDRSGLGGAFQIYLPFSFKNLKSKHFGKLCSLIQIKKFELALWFLAENLGVLNIWFQRFILNGLKYIL